jgi:O-antigen/teichoic acid export membrane protein
MMEAVTQEAVMQGHEVRRRAIAGVASLTIRGAVVRVIGFGGTVVLARLLVPHDFGLVAFGATLMFFARYLADGGIAAALIRTREDPPLADLQALLGLQLAITSVFAGATAIAASPFGTEGRIVAVMVASLPLTALRVPGTIVLERRLSYGPLVVVDVLETFSYFAWAIGTIEIFHWGVWGLATGAVVRAIVATVAIGFVSPVGLPRPTLAWRRVREPLGFGIRFQGVGLVRVIGDQSVNLGTAAIASVSTLGLWSLAGRFLMVPTMAFEALWRVGYPAMSRLLGSGENPRAILERGTALVATATGAMLVPLVGSTPALVPALFGSKWNAAASVIPWASLGLMVSGPISVTASGYLYAVGDVRAVLRSTAFSGAAFAGVGLGLLPVLGVTALGLGAMSSAFVEAFVLARAMSIHSSASIASPLGIPTMAACGAAGAGWVITASLQPTLVAAVLGGLAAEGIYLACLLVIRRSLVSDMSGMLHKMIQASYARA